MTQRIVRVQRRTVWERLANVLIEQANAMRAIRSDARPPPRNGRLPRRMTCLQHPAGSFELRPRRGRLSFDWLKPFTHTRGYKAGEVVFRRGDIATNLMFIGRGQSKLLSSGSSCSRVLCLASLECCRPTTGERKPS